MLLIPVLDWLKKIGPLDSNLINNAIIGVSHDSTKSITNKENIMSNNRFTSLFKESSNGIFLSDKIGI